MQSSIKRPALIVFGKNPVPGLVKTRLARDIGHVEAANLYRSFLVDSLDAFGALDVDLWLYLAPSDVPVDTEISDREYHYREQTGEGLGERMSNAFDELFEEGYSRVGIVGSDHPTLPSRILERGFAGVARGRVVVGPSEDGGYFFLALTEGEPRLFSGIRYGRDDVLAATLGKAQTLGLNPMLLDSWYDVDTAEDLIRLKSDLLSDPTICPQTRATMKHLGIL